jgi:hypothetical protein
VWIICEQNEREAKFAGALSPQEGIGYAGA